MVSNIIIFSIDMSFSYSSLKELCWSPYGTLYRQTLVFSLFWLVNISLFLNLLLIDDKYHILWLRFDKKEYVRVVVVRICKRLTQKTELPLSSIFLISFPSLHYTSKTFKCNQKCRAKRDELMRSSSQLCHDHDTLHANLVRLPPLSFTSAAFVSKSWSHVCNRILSRPKFVSALSTNPSLQVSESHRLIVLCSLICLVSEKIL